MLLWATILYFSVIQKIHGQNWQNIVKALTEHYLILNESAALALYKFSWVGADQSATGKYKNPTNNHHQTYS